MILWNILTLFFICRAVQHKQASVLGQIDELRERLSDLKFEQQQQREEVVKLNSKIYALTNYVERSRRVQKRVRLATCYDTLSKRRQSYLIAPPLFETCFLCLIFKYFLAFSAKHVHLYFLSVYRFVTSFFWLSTESFECGS